MTRRTMLHQRFYALPTKANLEELESCLLATANEHIMTYPQAMYIIEKAREYYDEMQSMQ
jgi:hypothetical protein